jgi:ABC-type dipeptide/oligopeptide/nickel transport system permease subunit
MRWKTLFRRMRKSKLFMIGSILLLLIVLVCITSPLFVKYDPIKTDLRHRLNPPEWFAKGLSGHVLGTDPLGRDVLTRLLIGGRASLFIAFSVVVPSALFGAVLGLLAGYYSKLTDSVIMRICDIFMATPPLLLALCVVAVMGNSMINLIFVLALTSWVIGTRMVRAAVLAVRNSEFILAAKVLGAGNLRIMLTEVLPNTLTPIIVTESQHFAAIVLTEAAMSFLGLGVPLPAPAWGSMIADGRQYLATAPWIVLAPGIALMLAVLSFNFLGDGLRDVLDPKNID